MAKKYRICTIQGCGKKLAARGFCKKHYELNRLHGTPHGIGTKHGEPLKWLQDVAINYAADDCLEWPFARTPVGYGVITHNGRQTTAQRVLCDIVHGEAPTDEHEVAHSCGNGHKGCVNPRHVRWATHIENCSDRTAHGTHRNMPRKLSDMDMLTIREIAPFMPVPQIAEHYGVTTYHAYAVISGRRGKV